MHQAEIGNIFPTRPEYIKKLHHLIWGNMIYVINFGGWLFVGYYGRLPGLGI